MCCRLEHVREAGLFERGAITDHQSDGFTGQQDFGHTVTGKTGDDKLPWFARDLAYVRHKVGAVAHNLICC